MILQYNYKKVFERIAKKCTKTNKFSSTVWVNQLPKKRYESKSGPDLMVIKIQNHKAK